MLASLTYTLRIKQHLNPFSVFIHITQILTGRLSSAGMDSVHSQRLLERPAEIEYDEIEPWETISSARVVCLPAILHQQHESRARRAGLSLSLLCITGLFIGTFFLGRALQSTIDKPALPKSLGMCSTNWREARGSGCVYDLILSSWLHPRCFNNTMYQKYLTRLDFINVTFWREPSTIEEIPLSVALLGEHDVLYTKGSFHHLHCSYATERAWLAGITTPKLLDTYSGDFQHIEHCLWLNGIPMSWEIEAKNVTRVYQPSSTDCFIG